MPTVLTEGSLPKDEQLQVSLASLNNKPAQYRIEAWAVNSLSPEGTITDGVKRGSIQGDYRILQTGGDGNLSAQLSSIDAGPEGSQGLVEQSSRFQPGNDPADERTSTEKEKKTRDSVASVRGEDAPVSEPTDPVKGQAETEAGTSTPLLLVGAGLGILFFMNR